MPIKDFRAAPHRLHAHRHRPASVSYTHLSYDLLSKRTHELRLASRQDARLRFVLGLFYEEQGDVDPVSYTHLDVYKRQRQQRPGAFAHGAGQMRD